MRITPLCNNCCQTRFRLQKRINFRVLVFMKGPKEDLSTSLTSSTFVCCITAKQSTNDTPVSATEIAEAVHNNTKDSHVCNLRD